MLCDDKDSFNGSDIIKVVMIMVASAQSLLLAIAATAQAGLVKPRGTTTTVPQFFETSFGPWAGQSLKLNQAL